MQPHSAAAIAATHSLRTQDTNTRRFDIEVRYDGQVKYYTIHIESYSEERIRFRTDGFWACRGEVLISSHSVRIRHDHTRTEEEYMVRGDDIYNGQQHYSSIGGRFQGRVKRTDGSEIELQDQKTGKTYEVRVR